jgi:hypothetical protein
MLRKLLWAGVLLGALSGCTSLKGPCDADTDCGDKGICDPGTKLCYEVTETNDCSPACAEYQACSSQTCLPRFGALKILSPADNAVLGGGPVQVSAQLVTNRPFTDVFPDTLRFTLVQNGGGEAGSFGPVTRNGDTYTATWTPPASAQGQFTLTVQHPVPEARLSSAVTLTVDAVPPTFSIAFSAPPTRSQGSATQADERDPATGYDMAFRRDESVMVSVAANEAVSDVKLTVVGIGPGATAGQAQPPVTVQPGGNCSGNPLFCGTATVDLSAPEMRDVRGSMDFRVEGQDAVGNHGSAAAGLKVTRWKWGFDSAGPISGSPAVGARGFVYVGTNVTTGAGRMLAVGPDGARKWEAAVGDTSGSPAVGAFNANEEYVYVAARNGSGAFLYALRGSDGTEKAKCSYNNVTEVPGSLAVGTTAVTVGTAETGAGIYSGSQVRLVGIRPDASLIDKCVDISGSGPGAIPASIPGGSFVMKDQLIFYGAAASKITSYDIGAGSSSPRSGWPQTTNSFTRGLALLSDQLYGAAGNSDDPGQGSLFSMPTASGVPISFVYPQANTSRVFNMAIGSGNTAYFGAETTSSAELLSLALGGSGASPMRASDVGTLRGAPVVGKNDRLYTLNGGGKVTAWIASSLSPLWNADLSLDLSLKDTSLTLDCRRDASGNGVPNSTLGSLYFAGGSKLYALIVDSPGLDPNAPWPKFQHDARNTGNPATPITSCP